MYFPFKPDQTYTIGALGAFERELSAARQADKALSEAWRVPETPEMKRWVKLREETYPIKLLADHKHYPTDATFRLKPYAFPAIDAELDVLGERFNLQITIADPIWGEQRNGGYDNRLLMEGLNRQGVVHGSGPFRRAGDKIVCDEPVKSGGDGAAACRTGLVAALSRKASRVNDPTTRLLIHARAHSIHVVDERFAAVASEAIKEYVSTNGSQGTGFKTIYVVDEHEFVEF